MNSPLPNLETLKIRLKDTWMAGDFGEVAKMIVTHAEDFIARRGLVPGERVLDVACGTGNLSIPAARTGAVVTGVDIATNLLDQARARARSEGLDIAFLEGDAEALPFPDGAFDRVVSMYGAMFAPRPELVAAELRRVCKSGGEVAMANWTPEGFVGKLFRLVASQVPPPPGMPPPIAWGDEDTVRKRLHEGFGELRLTRIPVIFHFPFSPAETVEFHRRYFGPVQRAFDSLPEEKREGLRQALEALWAEHNLARDGTTRIAGEYLEVVAQAV